MLSLAPRGVRFTDKCFWYLLAQRQEEAGANSSKGWEGEEIRIHQHQHRVDPASQQVAEEVQRRCDVTFYSRCNAADTSSVHSKTCFS